MTPGTLLRPYDSAIGATVYLMPVSDAIMGGHIDWLPVEGHEVVLLLAHDTLSQELMVLVSRQMRIGWTSSDWWTEV